jgi:hypothetical protein
MSPLAPGIHVSQVGYMCAARKRIVAPAELAKGVTGFDIQDMGRLDGQALGATESWKTAIRGALVPHEGPMGSYAVGDFSALERPGVYRAVLHSTGPVGSPAAWSFPFIVADGAYSRLPGLFLDYVHSQRCGDFENDLRRPCHLDDGVRSDTGDAVDASGGWHDGGDLRKWMATTPSPLLGFFELKSRLGFARNHWHEKPYEDDLLAESAWGLRWMLKMQDPATGMFFEDVGGGGDGRSVPGMTWWYENHSGCSADNSGNYFSDNKRASGDERRVRVQYNPMAQYASACILLDAVDHFQPHAPEFARLCRDAALRCWDFMKPRKRDEFHGWTSVIAWRLLAALRLHAIGRVPESELAALVSVLLDQQSPAGGWWFMDRSRKEPYRGIVSSAQPLIALATFMENDYEHPLVGQVRDALEKCREKFIFPMLATNPFGMMPYGLFSEPRTGGDLYHPGPDGNVYRFFMPTNAPEKVNHGLAGHWTSWAHALALLSRSLDDRGCRDAAFDQLAWMIGNNPLNVSMISGVGCRNAAPYSNFHGWLPGGFSIGPFGTAQDSISVDIAGGTEWSSGEYWLPPLANAAMALSVLLPYRVDSSRKLG